MAPHRASLLLLLPCLLASRAVGEGPYGAEPWLFWGDPVAPSSAIVMSARGSARFTVLAPALIRCETSPDGSFEDARTLAIWNRALAPPPFSAHTVGAVTTIDTGQLVLTYTDDGARFSDASLSVLRRGSAAWGNASAVWTPSRGPASDAGQLGGTLHTLDQVEGSVGVNCSTLDPSRHSHDTAEFFPCDFGLLSRSGFSVVDDARSPVWADGASGTWLQSQEKATCGAPADGEACFPGGQDTTDSALCHAAGCCSSHSGVALSLWYSSLRDDHFSDDANCSACTGDGYAFVRTQGLMASEEIAGLVPLNLYWNAAPGMLRGKGGDNVASTFPPTQPGYTFSRIEGWVGDPALPAPPSSVPLKLWYSAARLDHWTTAGAADEAAAAAAGYALVGLVGYVAPPPTGPSPAAPFACYRPGGHEDLYLFGHGADYDGALRDYVAIAGAVPIPRRSWMGISWSKWNETDTGAGTLTQVDAITGAGFPLDTYVFDMQWHRTPAWGGYSWDPVRYGTHDDVKRLLAALSSRGLATGTNFHDADGVTQAANPELFSAMAAAVGADASSGAVAFDIANKTYADALQRVVLDPLTADGLSLAWTDFQQGFPGVDSIRGLVPTALLNHYRFYGYGANGANASSTARGTLHSRYAGRGDHRHTSTFGGDVIQTWESLRFMIFFTATAANAPLCWWGHEMMRNGGALTDNSELFTRVNQFGAWSPIFTSWGNGGSNNDWWLMPEPHLSAVRDALLQRTALLPYRYTAAAMAHATGRCPIVPMYRSWPFEADAYNAPGQYLLGPDVIVAPAFAPVSPATGTVDVSVWLPPGEAWLDFANPAAPPSPPGSWTMRAASVHDVPAFVRAGAVIPQLPANACAAPGASAAQYRALVWVVYPGAGSGSGDAYEDDGASTDYLEGRSATTRLSYAPSASAGAGAAGAAAGSCTMYSISTTPGAAYAGMITTGREYSVALLASLIPSRVTLNGAPVAQSAQDGVSGTWFRTPAGDTRVTLLPCDTDTPQALEVCV